MAVANLSWLKSRHNETASKNIYVNIFPAMCTMCISPSFIHLKWFCQVHLEVTILYLKWNDVCKMQDRKNIKFQTIGIKNKVVTEQTKAIRKIIIDKNTITKENQNTQTHEWRKENGEETILLFRENNSNNNDIKEYIASSTLFIWSLQQLVNTYRSLRVLYNVHSMFFFHSVAGICFFFALLFALFLSVNVHKDCVLTTSKHIHELVHEYLLAPRIIVSTILFSFTYQSPSFPILSFFCLSLL